MNYEKLIIGCILAEPDKAGMALELVTPEMFTSIERDIILKIKELSEQGISPDMFIVANSLRKELEPFNGATYLVDISVEVATASKLQEYCLLQKQVYLEKLLDTYFRQGSAMCEDKFEVQKIMDFAQKGMEHAFTLVAENGKGFQHISAITEKSIRNAEKRAQDKAEGKNIGIPTGIRPLDRLLNGGFKPSTLNIIAARPAMGKTAVMLHFAKCAALAGVPVCIYALEMSADSLADRMLMSIGDMDNDAYKSGDFEQWSEIIEAQAYLSKLPIYIDDNPKVNMGYIRNHSRIMKQKNLCGIVFIDYLQLTDMSSGDKNRNREQEVAATSRQCKILSKELESPVVLLSQLSRATETRADKRPMLSDLRESGAIEQDADVVAFLYRADYYDIPDVTLYDGGTVSSKGIGEIIIAKQRDGATGDVAFRHNESMTQISSF